MSTGSGDNKNFHGTPSAMDADSLWCHSGQRHGFCYVIVLSNGDAKTYNHLIDLNIYRDDILVTETRTCQCKPNQIHLKILGIALRKIAAKSHQEGGKGLQICPLDQRTQRTWNAFLLSQSHQFFVL